MYTYIIAAMERLDHTNLDFEQLSLHCSKFIQDLVMFVMTHMHNDMEHFFKEHCKKVDPSDETHSHVYWELFCDYQKMLESKLDIFVADQKLTAKTLYKKLQEAQTENGTAMAIVQYLLGATDYERFVDLLLDRQLYLYGPNGVGLEEDAEKLFEATLNEGGDDEGSKMDGGAGGKESDAAGGKCSDGAQYKK